MKKLLIISLVTLSVLVILIVTILCNSNRKINEWTNDISVKYDAVLSVEISSTIGYSKYIKQYTNKDKIRTILNYISSLDLSTPTQNIKSYNGPLHDITFNYEDGTTYTYVIFGTMYFKERGKEWRRMENKQAKLFDAIYVSMQADNSFTENISPDN